MLGETNTPPSLGYNDYFLQTNALMQFTPPSWKLPYNTKQAQSAYAPICSRLVLSTFGLRPPVHSVCVAKPVTCCAAVTGNCSLNHFNCSLNPLYCSPRVPVRKIYAFCPDFTPLCPDSTPFCPDSTTGDYVKECPKTRNVDAFGEVGLVPLRHNVEIIVGGKFKMDFLL